MGCLTPLFGSQWLNTNAIHSPAMEDAHAIVLSLDEGEESSNTFFAVYDGHGGASYCVYLFAPISHRETKVEPSQSLPAVMCINDS
jgi:hypothetical protein